MSTITKEYAAYRDGVAQSLDLADRSRVHFEPELKVVNGALVVSVGDDIVANLPAQVAHPTCRVRPSRSTRC
jgi:hypothetical protein